MITATKTQVTAASTMKFLLRKKAFTSSPPFAVSQKMIRVKISRGHKPSASIFVLKRDLFTARFVVLSRKLNFQTFAGTFRYTVDCIFSNMNGHTCFLRNQTV